MDPRNTAVGTGTLGRMADVLQANGFRVGKTAVEAQAPVNLAGSSSTVQPIYALDENGASPLDLDDLSSPVTREVIDFLNGEGAGTNSSGVLGEVWSSLLGRSLNQTEQIYYLIQQTETNTDFATTNLGKRFKLISQLIKTRENRGVDRDFFFVDYGR